jgi:hypothetical protein
MSPDWEICSGGIGDSLTKYCVTPIEVLEYCGRLLYGQNLFEVLFFSIREMSSGSPETLGYEYPLDPARKTRMDNEVCEQRRQNLLPTNSRLSTPAKGREMKVRLVPL